MDWFRMGFTNLFAHKLRSFLTVLGVLIGTMSVLAVVTIGQSLEAEVVGQFDSIDERTIFVNPYLAAEQFGPPNANLGPIFTEYDIAEVSKLENVERVLFDASIPVVSLEHGDSSSAFREITATTQDNSLLRGDVYAQGQVFEPGSNGIVLGFSLFQSLNRSEPLQLGDEIVARGTDGETDTFQLVGVLAKPEGFFGEGETSAFVHVDPHYKGLVKSPQTGQLTRAYLGIAVEVTDVKAVTTTRDLVADYFDEDGPSDAIQLIDTEDYLIAVATPQDIQDSIGGFFDALTAGVSGIAVISLLVGAIGIANIMLVSIAERTKEIGMLKAIGAPDRRILLMFLTESGLMGLFGAVVGSALGALLGQALAKSFFDVAPDIPVMWIFISLAVGMGTGIVAGLIPAYRATKIQIVNALGSD